MSGFPVPIDPRAKARAMSALLAQAQANSAPAPLTTPIPPAVSPQDPSVVTNTTPVTDPALLRAFQAPPQGVPVSLPPGAPLPPPPFMGASYDITKAGSPMIPGGPQAPPAPVAPAPAPPAPTDTTDTSGDNTDNTDTTDAPTAKFDPTRNTDTFGSWFNKPQSSDALTAFGAAMLKAPTFMQGLGDAALAVNQVDRNNRMPTPQEIARANITDYNADGTGGDGSNSGSSGGLGGRTGARVLPGGIDEDGSYWTGSLTSAGPVYTQSGTGTARSSPPPGFVPMAQTGMAAHAAIVEKDYGQAKQAATLADLSEHNYQNILAVAPNANVGSSVISGMLRGLAQATGVDVGSDNGLSEQQILLKNVSQLQLNIAQQNKGLGVVTDTGRQIIDDSLPKLNSSLRTVFSVTTQYRLLDQMKVELVNGFQNQDPNNKMGWEKYSTAMRYKQRQDYPARLKEMVAQEIRDNPAYKAYTSLGKGTSTTPNSNPLTAEDQANIARFK